jgi:hypothetical protein
MNPFSLSRKLAAAFLLVGIGFGASAGAQTASDLQRSLIQAHWFPAHQAYQATPFQISIPVLRQMANDNYVIAQWFLADALAHQGQDEEATAWLYTASLGTRMDASLCKMRSSMHVEYRFLDAFRPQFDRIRKHEKNRYNALQKAVAFHRARSGQSAAPDWVCSMVGVEAKRPLRQPAYDRKTWQTARVRVLEDYQKQTGLDFSRSPDLFQITPVTKP